VVESGNAGFNFQIRCTIRAHANQPGWTQLASANLPCHRRNDQRSCTFPNVGIAGVQIDQHYQGVFSLARSQPLPKLDIAFQQRLRSAEAPPLCAQCLSLLDAQGADREHMRTIDFGHDEGAVWYTILHAEPGFSHAKTLEKESNPDTIQKGLLLDVYLLLYKEQAGLSSTSFLQCARQSQATRLFFDSLGGCDEAFD
jgi:hypothetical protein